jgi:hypothetical protein
MPFDQPKSNENKDGFCFDTLLALLKHGPCWDGDVPSKSGRDELLTLGYAVRVIHKGEDGYTGATYKGRNLFCTHMGTDTLKQALALQDERFEAAWALRNPGQTFKA